MTKRKILIFVLIILFIIFLKMISNFAINSIIILKYNNGKYLEKQAEFLKKCIFFESYKAHYNYGNILYQNGKYDDAILEYENALKKHVPKMKKCNIRINYALSICKTINVEEQSEDSIKKAIKEYENAIDVLTEDGCANKDDNNGHSQNAEKLKDDIQNEIDRLKKLLKGENDEPNNGKEINESQIEKNKVQDIKEEAIKRQREIEATYNNFNKSYKLNEKNW